MATMTSHAFSVSVSSLRVHSRLAHLLWVVAAAVLGFAVPAVFSTALEMPRSWFIAVYVLAIGPFLVAYARWSQIDLRELLRHHWRWGLAGGAVLAAVMTWSALRMDASPRPGGWDLAFDLLWLGVVYGVVDALLLNVLPVIAVWRAFSGSAKSWVGKIGIGALALSASLVVTAAYHLGYQEFRGSEVGEPLIGNGIMSLGYLLTANPMTAIVAHVALHVASVLHGIDTTVTLPPHY